MEILSFFLKAKLLVIFTLFFIQGYSTPLDSLKKQDCFNGFLMNINGEYRCIDTVIRYFPNYITAEKLLQYFDMLVSINLQLIEEPKWDKENLQEEKLRITFIENLPYFDSIVIYSFIKHDDNFIKLIKKEMPVCYPLFQVRDTSSFMYEYYGSTKKIFLEYDFFYKNIEKMQNINYKQTEFFIHKRKMQKLLKQLKKYPTNTTIDAFGWSPVPVFEYIYKGDYYQIISPSPETLLKLPTRMFSK